MIKIYTDGSCLGNPGNGGWAAIIIENEKKTQIKGSKKDTTNNQLIISGIFFATFYLSFLFILYDDCSPPTISWITQARSISIDFYH